MWYCSVRFLSGKNEIIVFSDEEEANQFFEVFYNAKNGLIHCKNNGKGMLINLNSVEIITEPKEYEYGENII